jgi:hypothetical protein
VERDELPFQRKKRTLNVLGWKGGNARKIHDARSSIKSHIVLGGDGGKLLIEKLMESGSEGLK